MSARNENTKTRPAMLRRAAIVAVCAAAVGVGIAGCAGPETRVLNWTSNAQPRTAAWVVDPGAWEHHEDHDTGSKDFTMTEYRSSRPETSSCHLVTMSNKLTEDNRRESDFESTAASLIGGGRLPGHMRTTVAVSGSDRIYKTVQVLPVQPSDPARGTVVRAFVSADLILGVTAQCDTPDEVRRALSPETASVSIKLTD